MKKNLFMVATVALMAMVSCNKENIENNNGIQGNASSIVFVAESDATRTALGEKDETTGIIAVNWEGNEAITVNGVEFTTTSTGARAEFTTNQPFEEAEVYTAIYPAAAGTSLTAVKIPAEQNGTFAEASISVAASVDQSLHFKNVASILKFQVYADFKGNIKITSDQNLAGVVSVTFGDDNTPVIGNEISDASKEIIVNGTFTKGRDYYIAVLPGEHNFNVYYEGFLSKSGKTAVTTTRAKISNLQTFPEPNLLYLVPNTNWKDAGARFAAYFFNSDTDNTWVNLSAYNGMYACEKPAYNTVIFCRMNPSDKANNWDTKWNQTGDMKIGSQKYCVIPFDVWDGSNVWSNTTTFDTTNRFYLFPSDNWKESGARFEVYFYGSSGSKWVTMTKFSTSPEYYEVVKPSGNWTNMIFVRKDPASAQGTWDAGNWGQTGDLNFTSGNFYTVVKWNEDGSGWSTKK